MFTFDSPCWISLQFGQQTTELSLLVSALYKVLRQGIQGVQGLFISTNVTNLKLSLIVSARNHVRFLIIITHTQTHLYCEDHSVGVLVNTQLNSSHIICISAIVYFCSICMF